MCESLLLNILLPDSGCFCICFTIPCLWPNPKLRVALLCRQDAGRPYQPPNSENTRMLGDGMTLQEGIAPLHFTALHNPIPAHNALPVPMPVQHQPIVPPDAMPFQALLQARPQIPFQTLPQYEATWSSGRIQNPYQILPYPEAVWSLGRFQNPFQPLPYAEAMPSSGKFQNPFQSLPRPDMVRPPVPVCHLARTSRHNGKQ